MQPFKVFLIDCGHPMAQQLTGILTSSTEPRFEVHSLHADLPDTSSALRMLSAAEPPSVTHRQRALSLFAFDQLPADSIVVPLLNAAHRLGHCEAAIVATNTDSAHDITHLLDIGATDVLLAPFRAAETTGRLCHWANLRPSTEQDITVQRLKEILGLEHIIGESPALVEQIQKIPLLANTDVSVLIQGATGTGKEVCARAIHHLSARSDQPFIAVNSGAIPAELAENELFGHREGAFTSANTARIGLIGQAHGGTLFLDEVDCLPLSVQVKLLRFLQDNRYRPLGCEKELTSDVRVIAASNADLESAVRVGCFRRDLYYRLNVARVLLPSLGGRDNDIELLARHFLKRYAIELRKPISGFTKSAVLKLTSHNWPGNVRELQNIIEGAALFALGHLIRPEDIELTLPRLQPNRGFKALKAQALHSFEREFVTELLHVHNGNISAAARAAGKERRTFFQLVRKHDLLRSISEQSRGLSAD